MRKAWIDSKDAGKDEFSTMMIWTVIQVVRKIKWAKDNAHTEEKKPTQKQVSLRDWKMKFREFRDSDDEFQK